MQTPSDVLQILLRSVSNLAYKRGIQCHESDCSLTLDMELGSASVSVCNVLHGEGWGVRIEVDAYDEEYTFVVDPSDSNTAETILTEVRTFLQDLM